MIILLHNGQVFAPNPLGKKDILIIGDKIGAISPPGKIEIRGVNLQIIDASEKIITPGFIDSHVPAVWVQTEQPAIWNRYWPKQGVLKKRGLPPTFFLALIRSL